MKRLLGLAVCALVAPALALAVPAAASAAPAGPADGLKKQIRAGYGVKLTESAKTTQDGKPLLGFLLGTRATGAYEFGRSGVAASDLTITYSLTKDFRKLLQESREDPFGNEGEIDMVKQITSPTRLITVKNSSYSSNRAVTDTLPAGKSWVRTPAPKPSLSAHQSMQSLNALEPATLAKLVKTAKAKGAGGVVGGARTTLYKGTITAADLYRVSPSFRVMYGSKPSAKDKTAVSWKLWLDSKNLPRRVFSVTAEDKAELSVDTRFTGWGKRLVVKAPPAAQVVDSKDLGDDAPETPAPLLPIGPSERGRLLFGQN